MLERLTVPTLTPPLARQEPFQWQADVSHTGSVQRRFLQHLWRLSEPARHMRQIRKNLVAQRSAPTSCGV